MTTLVSWITYSSTGEKPELPRAIYMASDSRITWGSDTSRWDAGRKIFSSRKEPHIFGYCGDVVFPSLVLGQIVAAIDSGALLGANNSPDQKHTRVFETIKDSHSEGHGHPITDFWILHVYRAKDWPKTEFHFWKIFYNSRTKQWSTESIPLPQTTEMVISLGSGAASARSSARRWSESDIGGTSRSFFSSVWEAIESDVDKLSGGPPQLCALYPQESPRAIGVIKEGRYFLYGLELKPGPELSQIKWKDELFQDIDPTTRSPKQGSRRFFMPWLKR